MSLLVVKFGGTSVGSAECIRRAAEIVRSAQKGYQVVVVVSAMGGVTDQIVEALHKAKKGSASDVEAICQALRKRHAAAVAELFSPSAREKALIAVLGEAMKGTPGILARLFSTVAEREVSVMAVAQGASELSICFAVPAQAANQVVQSVHDELCVSAARSPSNVRSSTRRAPQKVES